MRPLAISSVSLVLCIASLYGKAIVYPVAPELRSDRFQVAIGGHASPVAHAATTYYFSNFTIEGKTKVSVTAETDDYWSKGVEVQPWRWGIRPIVKGRSITFSITEPMKLSISRPGDHAAGAEMLFLFADAPETKTPKQGQAGIRYYGPGTYHENLNPKSGETIYLAPGAVIFGALNLWGVENVKVFGRGTIVYDGPQDPNHDEGWMHKRDWHVIVMDHARNIQISGITCIVRSRTWMIQMLGSRNVRFDNVKVIGGCPGNANQDGMDWLGGGDTVIRDSFFRASDDIFALYGNWLGYDAKAITTPGETVENILIEHSVLSTSISNVVRVSWPQKIFDSRNFTMRDSDVIHMGMGGCKVPFGLLEIWDNPEGRGRHENYSFENIRLESWYSLLQLRQQNPEIRDVRLKNIWALEDPSLTPSMLSGDVRGVALRNVKIGGETVERNAAVPVGLSSGAAEPTYQSDDGPHSTFQVTPDAVKPRTRVTFDASDSAGEIAKYEWFFGDGEKARGKVARHSFRDSKGSLVDGSGRFRVLLKVTDASGREDWSYRPVVVTETLASPVPAETANATLGYRYYEGSDLKLSDIAKMKPAASGSITTAPAPDRKRAENYAFVFDGSMQAPVDGGYNFLLLGNDLASLAIDSHVVAVSPSPKPQVCGMLGNMVQLATGTIGLKAGRHTFHVVMTHSAGADGFAVKWQGPNTKLVDLLNGFPMGKGQP